MFMSNPGVCDLELVEVRGSFVFPLLDGSVVDIPHDYTLPIICVSRDSVSAACMPCVSAMCFCHVLHLV